MFDETENLTLFSTCLDDSSDKIVDCDYICDFSQLTDLLLYAGNEGDEVIKVLSSKLSSQYDIPTIIMMEDVINSSLRITDVVLKIYKPHNKNENGEWVPTSESLYFIDSIAAKEVFERSPEGREYFIREALSKHLSLLNVAYMYYTHLIKLGFNEKQARKKSGLKDELLFRIAYFNHLLNDLQAL